MKSAPININSDCADDNVSSCVGSEIKVHEPKPITNAYGNELECHKVTSKGDDFNFGRIGEKYQIAIWYGNIRFVLKQNGKIIYI